MGLFSKLRNAAPVTQNDLAKSVLTPSVLTMISDGSVDDSEMAQLANLCSFSPIFASHSGDQTVEMIEEIYNELKSGSIQKQFERLTAGLTMPMRETALLFAIRVAMADGRIDKGEETALFGIAQTFGVEKNKFLIMVDVMAMLQRAPEQAA